MTRTPLLLLLVTIAGCGPGGTGVAEAPVDRLDPAVLYPMPLHAQWVYDVDTGGGEPPTFAPFQVVEREGDRAAIAPIRSQSANGQTTFGDAVEYEITPEGIRHVASGGWVLRRPIAAEAEWPAMGGRTAHVTDIDATVEVTAGTFEHCVEVTETGDEAGRTIVTTYCPEVGPVVQRASLQSELTMREAAARSTLRSFYDGSDGADGF